MATPAHRISSRRGGGPRRTAYRFITVVTALVALAAGMAVVAPPAPAATKAAQARDLPAIPSTPATKPLPQVPVGDFSNPPTPADQATNFRRGGQSSYDPARSTPLDDQATTPTRRVYRNPDGTRSAVLSRQPVRFQESSGRWVDIDLNLVSAAGVLEARAAPGAARLGTAAAGSGASLDTPAGVVGLRHPDAASVPAVTAGDTATYAKALPGGRDLVLTLVPDGVEETVVLPSPTGGPGYGEQLVLPAGLSARNGTQGVEVVDRAAKVVATLGGGSAHDAAFPAAGLGATTAVSVRVGAIVTPSPTTTSAAGAVPPATSTPPGTTTVGIEVSIAPAWLADGRRVFPVSIDPTFVRYGSDPGHAVDTFIGSGAYVNYSFGTLSYLPVGITDGGPTLGRALLSFDLGSIASPDDYVTNAYLAVDNYWSPSCTPKGLSLYGLGGSFTAATTWATQPPLDTAGVVSSTSFARGATGCPANSMQNLDATALAGRWLGGSPNYGLELRATDETDPAALKYLYSSRGGVTPWLVITYEHLPSIPAPIAPADKSVVPTATPILAVTTSTDPEGEPVRYWFQGTADPDATSGGRVINSGWLSATPTGTPCPSGQICYTVPAGALADGVTYHWRVIVSDPTSSRFPNWTWAFRVDLGLGDKGTQARDTLGGVGVNLASGNLVTRASSPSFPTAGGAAGLSYAYNSQAPPDSGLSASYYPDDGSHNFPAPPAAPAMVRTDPTPDYYWGIAGPGAGLDPANFMVRWTGTISVRSAAPTPSVWTTTTGSASPSTARCC